MRIQGKKYVIATKKYPILFDDGFGNGVEEFDEAELYESESKAQDKLSRFDNDCADEWCVVPVDVTYNF